MGNGGRNNDEICEKFTLDNGRKHTAIIINTSYIAVIS